MANLCREAALGPIRDAAHNIQHISAEEVCNITTHSCIIVQMGQVVLASHGYANVLLLDIQTIQQLQQTNLISSCATSITCV